MNPLQDLFDAMDRDDDEAIENAKDRLALFGRLILSLAVDRQGPAVRDSLDRVGVTPATWEAIDGATAPLREPIEKLYGWFVLEIRRLRAENWELAKTIARLELRVEQLEGSADVAGKRTNHDAGTCRGEGATVARGGIASSMEGAAEVEAATFGDHGR